MRGRGKFEGFGCGKGRKRVVGEVGGWWWWCGSTAGVRLARYGRELSEGLNLSLSWGERKGREGEGGVGWLGPVRWLHSVAATVTWDVAEERKSEWGGGPCGVRGEREHRD